MPAALIVVLVARPGDPDPRGAIQAIRENTVGFRLVVVDTQDSAEASLVAMQERADRILRLPRQTTLSECVRAGIDSVGRQTADCRVWVLTADCLPEPGALDRLVAELDRFPSVGAAGPKILQGVPGDQDSPRRTLRSVGLTMTTAGSVVEIGADQPDQAQYDDRSDTLAVPLAGMLVRSALWEELGGLEPALSGADAALDFGIRVRLHGGRLVVVPAARVAVSRAPEALPERDAQRARYLRQLSYPGVSPRSGKGLRAGTLLGLPVAVFTRGMGPALARVRGAWAAAGDPRLRARRRELAAAGRQSWEAIVPFLVSPAEAGRLSGSHDLDLRAEQVVELPTQASFWHSRAPLFTVLTLVISLVVWWRLLGANGLTGGASAPLPRTLRGLWRTAFSGFPLDAATGASDPFSVALGVVGSLTPWAPGAILPMLSILALPAAFIAGWSAAVRVTRAGWVRVLCGICWAFSPVLLVSLCAGELGAVAAHVAAAAALGQLLDIVRGTGTVGRVRAGLRLGCAVAAMLVGAPVAGAVAVAAVMLCMVLRPSRIGSLGMSFVPVLVAVTPAIVTVSVHGGWLGLLADPGVPVEAQSSPLALALGIPDAAQTQISFLPSWVWMVAGAGTVLMALLTLWLVLTRRSLTGVLLVLLALVSVLGAVVLANTRIVRDWDAARAPWTGGLLSLAGLSLLCGAALLLESVPGARILGAVLAVVVGVASVPFILNAFLGNTSVQPTSGPMSPAIVLANQEVHPGDRTLYLRALSDGSYGVRLQRGDGSTLTSLNRLSAASGSQHGLGAFAAGLLAGDTENASAGLRSRNVMFVLLAPGGGTARKSALSALNAESVLTPVGETSYGMLWQVRSPTHRAAPGGGLWMWVAVFQGILFVLIALCLLPAGRRRRVFSGGLVQPGGGDPDVAGRQ